MAIKFFCDNCGKEVQWEFTIKIKIEDNLEMHPILGPSETVCSPECLVQIVTEKKAPQIKKNKRRL
ncbi:hypothetical protein SEA_GIBBLES_107 [Gordonia phage Gibbles]|nr:hypothetical protein SEA_GIBBLES_107 [Gordonia phage Gibbles]